MNGLAKVEASMADKLIDFHVRIRERLSENLEQKLRSWHPPYKILGVFWY